MRLFEAPQRKPTINLTPLIDILFILIIFFVVSSKLIESQGLSLTLPQSSQGQEQPLSLPVLTVTANSQLWLNEVRVPKEQLPNSLAQQVDGQGTLVFRIDKKVPHGTVVELMGLAKAVGFQRVVFGTESLEK